MPSHQERVRKAFGEPCIDCYVNECAERGTCACVCHKVQAAKQMIDVFVQSDITPQHVGSVSPGWWRAQADGDSTV